MLSKRRGIHSKSPNQEDGNKQQCSKCNRTIKNDVTAEDNNQNEQLENKVKINQKSRGKQKNCLYPDLNEESPILCEACDNNGTVQETAYKVFEKSLTIKLLVVILAVVIAILVLVIMLYKYSDNEKPLAVNVYNQTQEEINFDNELYGLEDIYTNQEDRVWFTFAAGIKLVTADNPNKPSVFLMLYDNDRAESTVKCLAKDVTRAASKYLMKREIKPLIVAGKELNQEFILEDPGRLLVLHKDNVERKGAMIVTNLEDVNPKIAASFHFFCDRYSPLVEKAIYLFSLRVKSVPKVQKLQKVAEDTLQSLWANDLPDHILHPLITRITGNVLKISDDYSSC